jgi:hypothetical protein
MTNVTNVINLEKELTAILDNVIYDYIEEDLKGNGWEITKDINPEESIESFSSNVDWGCFFEVKKEDTIFSVYLSGRAIADISYERWVDTYGYEIEDFSTNIIN